MPSILVHHQEVALKGRNRPWFISTLVRTMRMALADLDVREVRSVLGRLEVKLGPTCDVDEVRARLRRLPGIANFSLATHTPADIVALGDGIVAALPGRVAATFAIDARRCDKRFAMASPDIERAIGNRVQAATGWRVDLDRPDLTIHVEVLTEEAFFCFGKERGTGGLPAGTSGRVVALLSGGIDSPVAAWRLMRRGCRVDFVHFHSYPILSRTSQDKARELVRILTRHELRSRLFLVPFGALQQQVVLAVPPPLRVVIYRRFMLRIAEHLAARLGAHGLVTGDAVGQVASQTVENLGVIGSVATLPILRPLIGFDKDEITAEAERIETYGVSIIQDDDCCTLFAPRSPATRATREKVDAAEAALEIPALVSQALAGTVIEDYRFPMIESRAQKRRLDEPSLVPTSATPRVVSEETL